MLGILYGVGVGPGDAELMTLKAIRIISENDCIALPGECPQQTLAYQIAVQAVPSLAEKELLPIPMPMTTDKEDLKRNHMAGAKLIENHLNREKNVVFLCLGDPSIYSTYAYIESLVRKNGYKTQMISGIPSFCAAAASANIPLAMWNESIKIVPAVHGSIDCQDDSNYIFMKAGKKLNQLKVALKDANKEFTCVENCGLENEHIYKSIDEIPDETGYYTLVIARSQNNA